jgi:hypothetical protein
MYPPATVENTNTFAVAEDDSVASSCCEVGTAT